MSDERATRPLKLGTRIEWDGFAATVVEDHGGPTLRVIQDANPDSVVEWHWECEGLECKVLP